MLRTGVTVASVRDKVSGAEWDARVELAACYRLVAVYGMTDMIANHISVAVPDEPHHFLINAYGLLYPEITASNLMKIDLDGNVLAKPELEYGFNRPGFVIHGAIHRGRPDAKCVIHTHSRAGMALSALKCGLLPLTQTATRFARVAYHDFEGISIDLAEQQSLVDDLGDAEVMVLRNHGLLAVGPSIPEAFNSMYRLELACKTQIDAMACNTELVIPSPEIVAKANAQWQPNVTRRYGELEWPAMLRMLDRLDTSYRE
ncbi:class II aldolase/adducin family protein [Paraburkholderia sp. ZP32-5]|uniref:class II aldolase/adducin family protein n=1 Tax=Paraburkholderia sp. ZP32-5 TaxID=2883245 RepID=UPI001F1E906C|nr:class II aldolase/adducin family protein [Paraburkholderia sp. ZP32-5]